MSYTNTKIIRAYNTYSNIEIYTFDQYSRYSPQDNEQNLYGYADVGTEKNNFETIGDLTFFVTSDRDIYKYDGSYITNIGIKNPELWESYSLELDYPKNMDIFAWGILANIPATWYALQSDTVDLFIKTGYSVEVGDIVWRNGYPMKVVTVYNTPPTDAYIYVALEDVDALHDHTKWGDPPFGVGDPFEVTKGNLLFDSIGLNRSGNLDGKYDYIVTLDTIYGYETNASSPSSIDVSKGMSKIFFPKMPYNKSIYSRLNIYRTMANKPKDYFFLTSIPIDFDTDYPSYLFNYDDFNLFSDGILLKDRDYTSAPNTLSFWQAHDKQDSSQNAACPIRADNSEAMCGMLYNKSLGSSYTIEAKWNHIIGTTAWGSFKNDDMVGIIFCADPSRGYNGFKDDWSEQPSNAYEFVMIVDDDGDTSKIEWRLVKWNDTSDYYTIITNGTFDRVADTGLSADPYLPRAGVTGFMPYYSDTHTIKIMRNDTSGLIKIWVIDKDGNETKIVDLINQDFSGQYAGFRAKYFGSSDTPIGILDSFKLYKAEDYIYYDNTPDSELGHSLHEYKIIPRKADVLAQSKGVLAVANGSELYLSEPYDCETFYNLVIFNKKIKAIGTIPAFDDFIVFTESTIDRVSIFGDYKIPLSREIGALNKNAIALTTDGVAFLSSSGLYHCRGVEPQQVINFWKVRDYIECNSKERHINLASLKEAELYYLPKRNEIWAKLGEGINYGDVILRYDIQKQLFLIYAFRWNNTNLLILDNGNQEGVYLADDKGNLYLFSKYYDMDDDQPIYSYIQSGEIGLIDQTVRVRRLYIEGINKEDKMYEIQGCYDRASWINEGVIQVKSNELGNEQKINLYPDVVATYQFKIINQDRGKYILKRFSLIYQAKPERQRIWKG